MARLKIVVAAMAGLATTGIASQASRPFVFAPAPRWAEEQETELVCKAIEAECSGLMKDGQVDASWGYAEVYDAGGYLVGIRTLKSTGCRPLDDHAMLGHRHFRTVFSKDDAPDLDDIRVELAPGVKPDQVRLVKQGQTQIGIGC